MTSEGAARSAPGARGGWRRLLETRGLVGGHRAPNSHTRLRSSDAVMLAASYLPGPPDARVAVLLVHGFAAHRRKPAYARLADRLSLRFPVLALDLRGHGQSGGACTLGGGEAADVAAGIRWLRAFGHPRVVVVGLSMGSTAVLLALAAGVPAEAAVVISAPARLPVVPETSAVRRLHVLWHSPGRRILFRVLTGVVLQRPDDGRPPSDPVLAVPSVRCPLLVVHGEDDPYFPRVHGDALYEAAGGHAELWREPVGFGHAEDGLTPPFVTRLVGAIEVVAAAGRFPSGSPPPRERGGERGE